MEEAVNLPPPTLPWFMDRDIAWYVVPRLGWRRRLRYVLSRRYRLMIQGAQAALVRDFHRGC